MLIGMGFNKRMLHKQRHLSNFVASQLGYGFASIAHQARPTMHKAPILGSGAMRRDDSSSPEVGMAIRRSARIAPLKFKF